jgi:hypothetical protein
MFDDPFRNGEIDVPPAPWDEADVRLLEELADLGMALARRLTERAGDPSRSPTEIARLGNAFSHVSRAIRLTLLLKARVTAERLRPPPPPRPRQVAASPVIERLERIERLETEMLLEPLEPLERERETQLPPGASFEEIVQRIARDLGVSVVRTLPDGPDGPHDWVIVRTEPAAPDAGLRRLAQRPPPWPGDGDAPPPAGLHDPPVPRGQGP